MTTSFQDFRLKNGLELRCYDLSNRYFGDYHRICLEIRFEVPLARVEIPADLLGDRQHLPATVKFQRRLERMGVATSDLETVRSEMLRQFLKTASGYLENPRFLQQLLRKQLERS